MKITDCLLKAAFRARVGMLAEGIVEWRRSGGTDGFNAEKWVKSSKINSLKRKNSGNRTNLNAHEHFYIYIISLNTTQTLKCNEYLFVKTIQVTQNQVHESSVLADVSVSTFWRYLRYSNQFDQAANCKLPNRDGESSGQVHHSIPFPVSICWTWVFPLLISSFNRMPLDEGSKY